MSPFFNLYIMIRYNRLDIEGDYLTVDVEIEGYSWYEEVFLMDLKIATKPNPTDDEVYSWSDEGEPWGNDTIESPNKRWRLIFHIPGVKDKLVYIIPVVEGIETIPPDAPCGSDTVNIGAAYNKRKILLKGMNYLKEFSNTCSIPKGFIDFTLRQKALDLAIATCNFNLAQKYFDMFTMSNIPVTKGCGCYGT